MDRDELLSAFRDTMSQVAATVYAITTGGECGGEGSGVVTSVGSGVSGRHGILATAVSSLSFDPPSLLVCINQSASLHAPLGQADRFCVNVLGTANRDVADCFASGASGESRFAVGDWIQVEGLPVLASAQSSLLCRRVLRQDFGTHSIFIGELQAAWHRGGMIPLVYYNRNYIDLAAAL